MRNAMILLQNTPQIASSRIYLINSKFKFLNNMDEEGAGESI